ncbi:MAG: hypothetical protein GVY13_17885 [Alphaproteobacteria bacterium]|jgi:aminoglycoside 3-N-acetyltransferase|nr:hypothetical protein [Alphaproteobacteria bacterium]
MMHYYARAELQKDFNGLGLQPGDTVMLHASIKSVGQVAGGADEILYALEDSISPGGTILMYVGCETGFDEIGRGRLSPQEEDQLLKKQPIFDYNTARACREFGALAEIFRTQPNTITSKQVGSRMAARGKNAAALLANHPIHYSYGKGSPLDKLLDMEGKILLLGSDHDAVTFLHYVEHIIDVPDKKIARYKVPLEKDGQRVWVEMEEYNTAGDGVHKNWPDRFFAKIIDSFLSSTNNQGGKIGNAKSHVIETKPLMTYASDVMVKAGQQTLG